LGKNRGRAGMKKIIRWLIDKEKKAERCYRNAAVLFSGEKELAGFLRSLAEDEKRHREILTKGSKFIQNTSFRPVISVDKETTRKIDIPFKGVEKKMASGSLTKEDLFDCIVTIEYSELNDLFVYVINTLKEWSGDFYASAEEIEEHKKYIEKFFESDPSLGRFLERIRRLPSVSERVLMVDASESTVELFKGILKDKAVVEGAADGKEALEKIRSRTFSAVITDVRVPLIDGIELYKKAIERYPQMNKRILFFTAYEDAEEVAFFKRNNLNYFLKPVSIKEIKETVSEILTRPAA
jgi:CheY-like chemotaxis protein